MLTKRWKAQGGKRHVGVAKRSTCRCGLSNVPSITSARQRLRRVATTTLGAALAAATRAVALGAASAAIVAATTLAFAFAAGVIAATLFINLDAVERSRRSTRDKRFISEEVEVH